MKMASRVINNFLNLFSISTSSDDNHSIRHAHAADSHTSHRPHRGHPKKEIHPFVANGTATDSVNSLSNHGSASTVIANLKPNEEAATAAPATAEASPRVFRRRATHEAPENRREVGNVKRLPYLRDTETSRKKRKETLKEPPKEPPKETFKEPPPRETPKEPPKEAPKVSPEATPKEPPVTRDLVKEARIDIETLKNQLVSCQKELLETRQKSSAAEKRVQTLERERDVVAARLKSAIVDRDALATSMEGRLSALDGRNRKQDAELRVIQDALRVSDEKNVQLSKLLEEKTADFKGTQTFLTTADLYSGAEIIGMVETLNAEIFQISAFTAELLENDTAIATEEERNSNVYQHADLLDMAGQRIGQEFLEHLNTKHTELREDPLPLQLAVQGLLSAQSVHVVQTFRSDELGGSLDQLYQRIKASEVQAVAGRWRAITSATLRDGRDYSATEMTLELIVGLLCLCGYSTSNQQSRQSFGTLQKMLYDLEKLQIKLKTAIKEGITTADFELASFGAGETFNPSWMENVYSEAQNDLKNAQSLEARVLTAVGVGLHKRVTKFAPGVEPKDQVDVLYKTKVVLLSVLHLFDEMSGQ